MAKLSQTKSLADGKTSENVKEVVDALNGTAATDITMTGTDIIMSALPTSDPTEAGKLWNDSATLKISAG